MSGHDVIPRSKSVNKAAMHPINALEPSLSISAIKPSSAQVLPFFIDLSLFVNSSTVTSGRWTLASGCLLISDEASEEYNFS